MREWLLVSLLVLVSFLLMLWGGRLMSEEKRRAREKERSWRWDDYTRRSVHDHYCRACEKERECEVEHDRTWRQPLGDGPYNLRCATCEGRPE